MHIFVIGTRNREKIDKPTVVIFFGAFLPKFMGSSHISSIQCKHFGQKYTMIHLTLFKIFPARLTFRPEVTFWKYRCLIYFIFVFNVVGRSFGYLFLKNREKKKMLMIFNYCLYFLSRKASPGILTSTTMLGGRYIKLKYKWTNRSEIIYSVLWKKKHWPGYEPNFLTHMV